METYNEKLDFESIYNKSELLQEMATVGRKEASKDLPNGMRLEVITSEYQNTGEEPHYQSKSDRYSSGFPQDVVAIHDNPPLTEDYKKAIYEWSKDNNKRGINNWVAVQIIWDALNNRG